jgi:hypothetical protein
LQQNATDEEMLRAMATNSGLSPAYRETIGRVVAELDILRRSHTEGLACYHSAWQALRMIREVETLGPPGAMRSEEAALATLGPEPVHEAQAIIEAFGQ